MMKQILHIKILNSLAVAFSLIGYLEWGGGNSAFLIEAEIEVLAKIFSDPMSVLHLLTVLPLLGQGLLALTLILKHENKILTLFGIGGIGALMLLIFFIGCIDINFKMIFSTLPFLITGGMIIKHFRHDKKTLAEEL